MSELLIPEITLPDIEQGEWPDIEYFESGCYSLDQAFGDGSDLGIPLRTPIEIYGREHNGKSTVGYFLGGSIRQEGVVGIMDTENSLDPRYIQAVMGRAGFRGKAKIISPSVMDKGKRIPRSHPEQITELADMLLDDQTNAIIIDSIGMYRSQAETEGVIGDANMGRRARDISQFMRRALSHMVSAPEPQKSLIMINHVLQSLSNRGHYTPGGRGKSYGSGIRMYMWRKDTKDDGSFLAECKVEKLRWRGENVDAKTANLFIIPGVGVAKGITAAYDCADLGLARFSSTVQFKTKEGEWESVNRISTLVKAERRGDMERFKPFFRLLKEHKERIKEDETDGE